MKNKIKIIIGVLIILVGVLVMINGLYNENKKDNIQTTTTNNTLDTTENVVINTNTSKNKKSAKKVVKTTKKATTKKVVKKNTAKQSGYKLTHYGWDCRGCSGNTAIGYNVRHTIYYNDSQFGKVRICAMSKSMPLYSIIKIKNYKLGGDITCIVIDRGVGSGVIDLLAESEKKSSQLGIQKNVQIEMLRKGR